MVSFKAKFPVLQELFAKNHRGLFAPPPPSGARVKSGRDASFALSTLFTYHIKKKIQSELFEWTE